MEFFGARLKEHYQSESYVRLSLFGDGSTPALTLQNMFVNLVVVQEESQRKKEIDQLSSAQAGTLPDGARALGLVHDDETVLGEKTPIKLEDLFKPKKIAHPSTNTPKEIKKILLLGRAGIGKSTLCRYLAFQWAQGRLLQEFGWVFHIELKRLVLDFPQGSETNKTVWHIVYNYYWVKENLTESQAQQTWQAVQETGRPVLFLLDGYDEVAHLHHLLKDILLSQPYYLLTSRPYALIGSGTKFDEKLENVGLLSQDIQQYITNYFSYRVQDDVAKDTLAQWLAKQPRVRSMRAIPLYLELLCTVWVTEGEKLRRQGHLRLTDLFSLLVEKLLERMLGKMDPKRLEGDVQVQIDDLHTVPEVIMVQSYLAKLAFEGLIGEGGRLLMPGQRLLDASRYLKTQISQVSGGKSNMLVAPVDFVWLEAEKELCDAAASRPDLVPYLLKAGFLKNIGDNSYVNKNAYYFLHLNFQEYFAGLYVYQRVLCCARDNKLTELEAFLHPIRFNPRYQEMLVFAAGLFGQGQAEAYDLLIKGLDGTLTGPSSSDIIGHHVLGLLVRCTEENWDLAKQVGWVKKITRQLQSRSLVYLDGFLPRNLDSARLPRPVWAQILETSLNRYYINQKDEDDLFYGVSGWLWGKEERLELIFSLGWLQLPTKVCLDNLTPLINDQDYDVRREAMDAVFRLGPDQATDDILTKFDKNLDSGNLNERKYVCDLLGMWGPSAAKPIILKRLNTLSESGEPSIRRRVVDLVEAFGLAALGKENFWKKIVAALRDRDESVHVSAALVVRRLDLTAATLDFLVPLAALLGDEGEDQIVRENAVNALSVLSSAKLPQEFLDELAKLLGSDNKSVRLTALLAVNELQLQTPTQGILDSLIKLVGDEHGDIRECAVKVLGNLSAEATKSKQFLEKIRHLLATDDLNVRRSVVEVVVTLGSLEAISSIWLPLSALLFDDDATVRWCVVQTVSRLKEDPGFEALFENETWEKKQRLAETLVKYGMGLVRFPILQRMARLLNHKQLNCHLAIVERVTGTGEQIDDAFLEKLTSLLTNSNASTRDIGVWAIGTLDVPVITEALILKLVELLDNGDGDVRHCALTAVNKLLPKMQTKKISEKLATLLDDSHPGVRSSAAVAVKELAPSMATTDLLEQLVKLLGNVDANVHSSARLIAGKLGSSLVIPRFLEVLTKLLRDPNSAVRSNAVSVVVELGSSKATPDFWTWLAEQLGSDDKNVCKSALKAIRKLGLSITPEILKGLASLLSHSDPIVRMYAFSVVEELGVFAATPEILEKLATRLVGISRDSRIVSTLVTIGLSALLQQKELINVDSSWLILGISAYLSGNTSLSVCQESSGNWSAQGCVGDQDYKIVLTATQANWLRVSLPQVISAIEVNNWEGVAEFVPHRSLAASSSINLVTLIPEEQADNLPDRPNSAGPSRKCCSLS